MDRPSPDAMAAIANDARVPRISLRSIAPATVGRPFVAVLALWVLRDFADAILAASLTAIASWTLYTRFGNWMPARLRRTATPLAFALLVIVFALAPMIFALIALVGEAHRLILQIAAADQRGIAIPDWLQSLPIAGPWIAARWPTEPGQPGTLLQWSRQADPAVLMQWAQSLGQFTAYHAINIVFAVLLLLFLYRQGEALATSICRVLRQWFGPGVDHFIDLGVRAVRASVNGMLVVGLFDGLACTVAFAVAGVPHPAAWGALTGLLAIVPFLGYVAAIALALQMAMAGSATTALAASLFGCGILLFGDKVVRPLASRGGVQLPFVWMLMGCMGGFQAFGFVGLALGPVLLTLARELWQRRSLDAAGPEARPETMPDRRSEG